MAERKTTSGMQPSVQEADFKSCTTLRRLCSPEPILDMASVDNGKEPPGQLGAGKDNEQRCFFQKKKSVLIQVTSCT